MSARPEVWARAAQVAVDIMMAAGVPLEPVFAGLSFDAQSLRHRLRVPFDEYCIAIERAEALTGYDQIARHVESTYFESASEMRALAALFVSPKALCHFVFGVLDPIMFPPIAFSLVDVGPDHVRLTMRYRPGTRPSAAVFRMTVPATRMLPTLIGLPPAEVDAAITPYEATLDIHLPPDGWRERVSRASRAVVRIAMGQATDGSRVALDFGPSATPLDPRLAGAASAWELTPRQREVLGEVAHGVGNRDIATRLGMSEHTVDAHVSELLRKAGLQSRAQLIAAVWSRRR